MVVLRTNRRIHPYQSQKDESLESAGVEVSCKGNLNGRDPQQDLEKANLLAKKRVEAEKLLRTCISGRTAARLIPRPSEKVVFSVKFPRDDGIAN